MIFDPNSSTWLVFEKELDQERTDLLEQLCAEGLKERAADVIRGKIAMIDYIVDDIKTHLTNNN